MVGPADCIAETGVRLAHGTLEEIIGLENIMLNNLHDQFKKMNDDFKKTIASLSKDVEADVLKLKTKLKAKEAQDTLEPFIKFAEAIATLDADHVITEAGGIQLRAIDFQLLKKLIKSDSE